jgi:CRP/FNR family transcriptional regulator, cyclic AMP receptor protein
MQTQRIEWLQRMPIFGAIHAEALECLLETAPTVSVSAGAHYFREGDAASCMFVLEHGRAAVLKAWQGAEHLLRRLEPGDCFGEMALLDLQPRSASVLAELDCSALQITPDDLYRLCKRDTEQFALVQMNIGREVCRRLRATDEMLFRAAMGQMPEFAPEVYRKA